MRCRSLALTFLLLTASALPVSAAPVPARERTVVVLSLDGFPASLLHDPFLPAPTLRRLIREGAAADALQITNPAVTWPNHATLVTGVDARRHGVLFNGLIVRGGEKAPVAYDQRERSELVRVPTIYDVAHAAGLTTAQVNWVPHQVDGTITWAFHERPRVEGPVERSMIDAGALAADELPPRGKGNNPWRDALRGRAARFLLGGKRPNLLLMHFLNLDDVHHRHGHGSPAGMTAVALLDAELRSLLDVLESPPLRGRVTLLVVSDHGFKRVRRVIRPNAVLREAGLLRADGLRVAGDAYAVCQGGTAVVYWTGPAATPERRAAVLKSLGALDGIAAVTEPDGFAALGLPTPAENPQMGDVLLTARDGYGFDPPAVGAAIEDVGLDHDRGAHGYLASDPDMDALFVAWGYGIRTGARPGRVSNLDVAPTIAALLGLEMKDVTGRPIAEILAPAP